VLATPPRTGAISVTTSLAAATFTITGPASFSGSGLSATFNNAPVGTYTITFGPVVGYITPSSQTQTLAAGGTIAYTGTYAPSRQITTNSIEGWNAGNAVSHANGKGSRVVRQIMANTTSSTPLIVVRRQVSAKVKRHPSYSNRSGNSPVQGFAPRRDARRVKRVA